MPDDDRDFLVDTCHRISFIAEKLRRNERPGHVAYISKRQAADALDLQLAFVVARWRLIMPLFREPEENE